LQTRARGAAGQLFFNANYNYLSDIKYVLTGKITRNKH